ncbi:hypothetical protein BH23CHL8_BH23CHL8_17110 [soil metagenome]
MGAGRDATLLRSQGFVHRPSDRAWYRHHLRVDDPSPTWIVVDSVHDGANVVIRAVTADSGCRPVLYAGSARTLAEGGAAEPPELARLGRYPPFAGLEFLRPKAAENPQSDSRLNVLSFAVDLDAVGSLPETLASTAAAAAGLAVRHLPTMVGKGNLGSLIRIEYELGVPIGDGSRAQQASWVIQVRACPTEAVWAPDDLVDC